MGWGEDEGLDFYDPYTDSDNIATGLWTQKSGVEIRPSEMNNRHLRNTIKLCERNKQCAMCTSDEEHWQEWIDIFETELSKRGPDSSDRRYDSPDKVKKTRGTKVELICHCGNHYQARVSDIKRGYAKSCCKRCSSIKRDYGRPDPKDTQGRTYDTVRDLLLSGEYFKH